MNNIKNLRIANRYSQEDLAKILNISQNTISRYENGGRKLPPDTIAKLCEVFNCSADYLLGLSDQTKKEPAVTGELAPPSEEFIRLQQANELFLQLDEAGRAQALAYLKFLASQQEN